MASRSENASPLFRNSTIAFLDCLPNNSSRVKNFFRKDP
ncbi:hypothetical protein RO3G_11367 [Rhizopus delemar RA 99-880]|uniref:Uncharacterized protein n=1 Tax=Rhizopus delemar (strain RA 99-880 / ATCC MYA-4621 / FGSC 9543 / NRRL 43880) TaxID=246409 RepID=I1CDX6_RHIO9|nr:hypothetical protein RO3G_11367 [Rhizopus delemar RA 99-880]|eukprot:EIE86656.1 hypothetical protein RO3G_11367 [Rhizopus delemar RA 99-880]